METNIPTINKAWTNTETLVVLKDKNINTRDMNHKEKDPRAINNVQ